ncbi:alpha/beta hydrolase [Promicromonospora sp. NPDC057488]|uniref:alpha/beta hydrolase n=1 Tax=Promicromonospora sp. NPDC057488 TaxID=3346147 RepID=UPI00366DD4D8
MASEVTDASGLIDPDVFPFRSGALWTSLDDVSENARFSRQTGQTVGQASHDMHAAWAGLREHYQAPEGEDLYHAMDPTKRAGDREWDVLNQAGGLLDAYVEELMPVRQLLSVLEAEAAEFRSRVTGGVMVTAEEVVLGLSSPLMEAVLSPEAWGQMSQADWERLKHEGGRLPWTHHRPSLERNRTLVADATRMMEQIRQAGQDLAKGLDNLDSGAPLAPAPGPVGSGVYAAGFQAPGIRWLLRSPAAPDVSAFAPGEDLLGGTAGEVRAWWDALTPAQRSALIAAMPLVIGNLNGVPLKYRAQANTISLKGEIASMRAEQARIDQEIAATRALRFGTGDSTQINSELVRLTEERERLDEPIREYEHYLHLDPPQYEYDENGLAVARTDVEVVVFDPTVHAIATYHGRYDQNGDVPEYVDNLAVYVPGTKTRIDHFNGADTRAYDLYDEANGDKFGPGRTAVIAWAGGRFPQFSLTQPADAALASYSEDLGPKLRDFVGAVDTHPQASTLTVTGHSYGGAVVGKAEAAGLAADQVLYVAGAGIGNGTGAVTDFPETGDIPHFSMMARNDPVVGRIQGMEAGGLGHGASPLTDPDVKRLETGFVEADRPESGTIESTDEPHSDVYTRGSTAFNNMIGVITRTQVELFAPDRGIAHWYGIEKVTGIEHPGYQADIINLSQTEPDPEGHR